MDKQSKSEENPREFSPAVGQLQSLGVRVKRVERPSDEREARRIVAQAFAEKLTLLPCGGGTSLAAGVLPESVDIALDMTGLNGVLAFDPRNLNVAVLSGMTLDQINAYLGGQEKGFFLPLDPPWPQRATIGGVYAANSSGPSRLGYGTVRDQVLGIRGADARGREVGFGGKTIKNVSGYDLTKFFIGSSGSLGLITSLSFRVFPYAELFSLGDLILGTYEELEKFLAALRSSVLIPTAVVVTELAGGWDVSSSLGLRFRVMVAFEGQGQAVDRQNRDLLKLAERFGGRGETVLGRDMILPILRSAIEPDKMDSELLALKISVPIAQGLSAYVSAGKIGRDRRLRTKAVLYAGNGVIFFYAGEVNSEEAAGLISGLKEIGRASGGYVTPIRVPRHLLTSWGSRMDPVIHRSFLLPIKEKLDPTGVFPPVP